MALQTISDGESGLDVRTKLNENFTELYALGTWVDYVPTFTGYSADPTVSVSRSVILGKLCIYEFYASADGTSNATTKTITLPAVAKHDGNMALTQYKNNGTTGTAPGLIATRTGSNIADLYLNLAGAGWTASGAHRIFRFMLIFEVE